MVSDVMTRRVKVVRQEETTEFASAMLRFRNSRYLPVLDAEDRVIGMLSPTDVLARVQRWGAPRRFDVSDAMRQPVQTVREDDDVEVALGRMRDVGTHALPVVDRDDRIVGMVSDVDILFALANPGPPPHPFERTAVDEVMTDGPVTVTPDTCLADAAQALVHSGFRHLPVLDGEGRLVGMISERDLTQLGLNVADFWGATLRALEAPVREAMTQSPISVQSGTRLADVLRTFARERVGAIPVVDQASRFLGIVSFVDVLLWLSRHGKPAGSRATTGWPPAP